VAIGVLFHDNDHSKLPFVQLTAVKNRIAGSDRLCDTPRVARRSTRNLIR
jgi:hypothetical protein